MLPEVIFSIIIPTCHRNDLLEKCLSKLTPAHQGLPSESYEVIVTDDGKKTTAQQLVQRKFAWVRWTEGPGKGPAANRNFGATLAKGQFIVFTDDDCLPDPQWLQAYKRAIEQHPDFKIFEGKTYADTVQISLSQEAPINLKGNKLFSCNLCIEKETFDRLTGFDEDFSFSFEDMEFAHRLKLLNIPSLFVEDASVCHPWRDIGQNAWKSSMRQSKGICMFVKKHPEVLMNYNSFFFLKRLPAVLYTELLPNLLKYRGKGAKVVLVHSFHYCYMATRLLIPTLSTLFKGKYQRRLEIFRR